MATTKETANRARTTKNDSLPPTPTSLWISRVLLYPFAILGSIPLLIGLAVDKRDKAANVFDMDYESF
ncbi:hypothetical protein LOS25_17005 [Enterococcus faecium]|nr:hypothetical protein [Enterococcus faecium]